MISVCRAGVWYSYVEAEPIPAGPPREFRKQRDDDRRRLTKHHRAPVTRQVVEPNKPQSKARRVQRMPPGRLKRPDSRATRSPIQSFASPDAARRDGMRHRGIDKLKTWNYGELPLFMRIWNDLRKEKSQRRLLQKRNLKRHCQPLSRESGYSDYITEDSRVSAAHVSSSRIGGSSVAGRGVGGTRGSASGSSPTIRSTAAQRRIDPAIWRLRSDRVLGCLLNDSYDPFSESSGFM